MKTFSRNKVTEWSYSQSGLLLIHNKRTKKIFVLKESYILIWILLRDKTNVKYLQKHSGIKVERVLRILEDLVKRNLVRIEHSDK